MNSPASAARRRCPWGFLGALALVLLCERGISRQAVALLRPEATDWRSSSHAASTEAVRCKLLCFGSSRTQQGLAGRILAERSGLATYNLSYCWNQASGSYFLLRKALSAGARPRAVVVEFHPPCIADSYRSAIRMWPNLIGPLDALDLAWTARDAEFLASVTTARAVPSVHLRAELRERVLKRLAGDRSNPGHSNLTLARNKRVNAGSMIVAPDPSYRGDVRPDLLSGLAPDSWTCNPINARYIDRFLELARSHHIAVFWVIPPNVDALNRARAAKGAAAAYERFARSFLDRYPNLVILDAEHARYADSAFVDAAHLHRQGATAFSLDVADAVRRNIGSATVAERWLTLPDYRPITLPHPIEDMAGSSLAIHKRRDVRR